MHRFGDNGLARAAILAAVAVLLLGAADVHALLHGWRELAAHAALHDDHHPEPVHLDHGSLDVPCPACLGLHGQGRPVEGLGPTAGPEEPERWIAAAVSSGVADLSFRLPLSRAPPLS